MLQDLMKLGVDALRLLYNIGENIAILLCCDIRKLVQFRCPVTNSNTDTEALDTNIIDRMKEYMLCMLKLLYLSYLRLYLEF